jgi:hypothetical protein
MTWPLGTALPPSPVTERKKFESFRAVINASKSINIDHEEPLGVP